MKSRHQTKDHDMSECDMCVNFLKICSRWSQTQIAWRAERKRANSTPANNKGIKSYTKRRAELNEENSISFEEMEVRSDTSDRLNEDLIDMHMDMQLLSSL